MMTPADPSSRQGPSDATASEAERAIGWLQRANAENELVALIAHRVRRRRQRRIGLVAMTCLAFAAVGITWRRPVPTAPEVTLVQVESNAAAIVTLPRREVLPDGSVVEFNDGAEIGANFSEGFRRIRLLRGEAHFQVAKDVTRPFIVTAQGVEVRAVGTAFSVQLGASAVEVLVTEGRVAVDARPTPEAPTVTTGPSAVPAVAPDATSAQPAPSLVTVAPSSAPLPAAVLEAGHRARIRLGEPSPEVTPLPSDEMVKRLAWRVPQLEFSRTPLAEIITLMNHHSHLRGSLPLVIDDASSALAEVKLSGYLAADNTAGMVRLLETNFRVRAEISSEAIRLHYDR